MIPRFGEMYKNITATEQLMPFRCCNSQPHCPGTDTLLLSSKVQKYMFCYSGTVIQILCYSLVQNILLLDAFEAAKALEFALMYPKNGPVILIHVRCGWMYITHRASLCFNVFPLSSLWLCSMPVLHWDLPWLDRLNTQLNTGPSVNTVLPFKHGWHC